VLLLDPRTESLFDVVSISFVDVVMLARGGVTGVMDIKMFHPFSYHHLVVLEEMGMEALAFF
jgi:hypothetical protein